jgi:protein phosphatase 1 regulatory subunit 11
MTITAQSIDDDAAAAAANETIPLTLRLKPQTKKGITWTDDTVDNEFMNKKSSKQCCIYHKPRAWNESSSDDDDDDDDDDKGKDACGGGDGHVHDGDGGGGGDGHVHDDDGGGGGRHRKKKKKPRGGGGNDGDESDGSDYEAPKREYFQPPDEYAATSAVSNV